MYTKIDCTFKVQSILRSLKPVKSLTYNFLKINLMTLARNITCSVNKYGLKGTYDVRVVVDDKKYETGIQITC